MPDRLILPPLRRTAADAERFARAVHADQRDKAGRPYVGHLERVRAGAIRHFDKLFLEGRLTPIGAEWAAASQIAWLHDVIEDTEYTAADLLAEGFSPTVVEGIEMLSKTGLEPYGEWIARLCASAPLPVLIVKLADMEDNSDPTRLALLPEDVRARLTRKYAGLLVRLRAAVEGRAGHSNE